jgi:hypothetical protein
MSVELKQFEKVYLFIQYMTFGFQCVIMWTQSIIRLPGIITWSSMLSYRQSTFWLLIVWFVLKSNPILCDSIWSLCVVANLCRFFIVFFPYKYSDLWSSDKKDCWRYFEKCMSVELKQFEKVYLFIQYMTFGFQCPSVYRQTRYTAKQFVVSILDFPLHNL